MRTIKLAYFIHRSSGQLVICEVDGEDYHNYKQYSRVWEQVCVS